MDASAHAASMVGCHFRVDDFYEVGREKVREYARAVQDFHPAHHDEDAAKGLGYDGLLAPLTFVSLLGIMSQTRMLQEVITGYDPSQILQTDQKLEFHRPIQVGDRIFCDVYLESFRQMGGSDIMTTKNIITDQNGNLVQTTWTTIVARTGGEIDENIAHAVKEVIRHGAS
ncbi:(3R)-hydroxyacyl-ACP dehydratase subunit HadA [Rhodococcus sp. IEGM 1401]|uniref:(3R)-hydroxyacyl-ACP dehydratase subunit HadA n=1 Tax=unclassified Rhodococcus (in: high G+C Gram-positive bacteria) TaxID=192944 RepID=UPI0022B2C586|nr:MULTISPECIES: (3R)-hydroxyacyl-ACP dehydratase subunit HadA [unclassified Rhodococcus (in: high G+C Gram-positive bacteria)]MCZ4564196.1 (3R)-hydroxyacyl-ACP dehydratase subunit HadA [Rhodococcus sp. IEGM 1401]MDI6628982.1 (3R)-hydroxyacyl-ACP dehydratase subunit HadA [Rhodococcus sp. (in: high G+C Gram-positive bacteria)]MDI9924330.1 (3R)-hydroxyacyl-ACP dehydratase subunit HadA [Rhodococcus sp. IEGM 1372]MDV8036777.1 (3R)-hydroxyacyl-ACP dehydratase subunit HadA [Rhodococcus sp. IEGM 1414]